MKAFISLSKVLIFFIALGCSNLVFGQACTHLVIEDLGDPECNWTTERTTFRFCVSISSHPETIPANQPHIYAAYSVGGVDYTPIKIEWSSFVNNGCVRTACITPEITTPSVRCTQEVKVTLMTKIDKFTYEIYPIYDYNGVNQIFDCYELLDIECEPSVNWCSSTTPGLPNPNPEVPNNNCPAIATADIDLCCGQAFQEGGNPGADDRNSASSATTTFDLLSLQATPNPFKNELQVNYQVNSSEKVRLQLVDLSGRSVYESEIIAQAGEHQETINTEQLNNGVYYISLQTSTAIKTIKLIKL